MPHRSIDIAKAFLKIASSEGKTLTHMKLQKLVFFAHGVNLAAYGEPLIVEDVKAWKYGPVIPNLYDTLFYYGKSNVNLNVDNFELDDPIACETIKLVWDVYGKMSAWQLSEISHIPGSPWDTVWNKGDGNLSTIPNEVIEGYYSQFIEREKSEVAQ